MIPTIDQISRAAYFRWLRRGHDHGRDQDDWLAAEQEVLFAMNYEVAVHHVLDAATTQYVGSPRRRVCRFCERAAPATTFAEVRPALSEALGNRSLLTYEECDECHELFAEGIEADLHTFLARVRAGLGPGGRPTMPQRISIAALKGLARMALSIMPATELHSFEDTIEWVGNPDHEFDGRLFGQLGCELHVMPSALAHPWVALARRKDSEAPMPYMVLFLGTGNIVVQAPVPLCIRDEDLDGEVTIVPRTCSPLAEGLVPAWDATVPLSTASSGVGRDARSAV